MNLEMIKSAKIKTILQFSVPSIIAMVLTSLITVVDGFFIGNYVGKEGLAAVNLGLPVIYLFLALGLMISVGGMVISTIALGSNDIKKSISVFNQTMSIVVFLSIALSAIMFLCFDPMLKFLNVNIVVSGFFKDYYEIMLLQLPLMVIIASFGMFIRGEGKPEFFMKVNILNVLINIVLDYIFIRLLNFGIKGIAFSSLIAAIVTLILVINFFIKKSSVYKFSKFKFSKQVLTSTILNGSSEFVGEISLSICLFAYNYVILRDIGVDGLTAFAIVGYISYIFNMILIGFGQGASPLISFTYGAKEHSLAANLRKITNTMVFILGAVVFCFMLACSQWYSGLFVKNALIGDMVRFGVTIFAISFLFSGINTISSFYFTSIEKAIESAIISSARGLVFLLILIFTLPPLLGMTGVWLVAPITEILTLVLTFIFITKDKREFE